MHVKQGEENKAVLGKDTFNFYQTCGENECTRNFWCKADLNLEQNDKAKSELLNVDNF